MIWKWGWEWDQKKPRILLVFGKILLDSEDLSNFLLLLCRGCFHQGTNDGRLLLFWTEPTDVSWLMTVETSSVGPQLIEFHGSSCTSICDSSSSPLHLNRGPLWSELGCGVCLQDAGGPQEMVGLSGRTFRPVWLEFRPSPTRFFLTLQKCHKKF